MKIHLKIKTSPCGRQPLKCKQPEQEDNPENKNTAKKWKQPTKNEHNSML